LSVVEGSAVALAVAVPVGVELALALALELAEALELALGLGEGLTLALTVPLGLLVGDVADVLGVPLDPVVLLGELDVDDFGDECTEDEGQADFDALGTAPVTGVGDCAATEGAGVLALAPSGFALIVEEPLMAALRVEPNWATACRALGTAARTKPIAKTAAPIAKAGRSIASRQSTGRRAACRLSPWRREACFVARPEASCRNIASHTPKTP
jgi:hypothetical protein